MKKKSHSREMAAEYDFSGGVRGEYAKQYADGTNLVAIEPDVSEYFPDHESVNQALRDLVAIIKRQRRTEQGTTGEHP